MATPLYTYQVKSPQQVHDDFLRTISNGLIARNNAQAVPIPNFVPNTGPGSDYDLVAWAVANEIAVGLANGVIQADQVMPDTAAGAFLDRWLSLVGLGRSGGTGSFGNITTPCSVASTVIVTGQQLIDPSSGLRFQVSVGGTYSSANGVITGIPVQAIDVGIVTNKPNGYTLQWVSAPPFCDAKATVGTPGGTDGLVDGTDSEVGNDEPPRSRLFARLQNPPRGGNWSDVAAWASASSPYVQLPCVYPALAGPSTVGFVVARAPQAVGPFTSTSKNRSIASSIVSGTVVPYVQGQLPEHAFVFGASVVDQPANIALLLSLPSAATASPPGPGGGWTDGTPWPSTMGGTAIPAVGTVTSSTVFQVVLPSGASGPSVGSTTISYLSPNTWTLYTAHVLAASLVSGTTWSITVDTPFPDVFTGAYVFPASVNQANYVAAALQAFANLGPGEWTANPSVLGRAYRHPRPSLTAPYALDANFLRVIEDAGPEVLTAQFVPSVGGGGTAPTVPASVLFDVNGNLTTAAPSILVPANIGIYAS